MTVVKIAFPWLFSLMNTVLGCKFDGKFAWWESILGMLNAIIARYRLESSSSSLVCFLKGKAREPSSSPFIVIIADFMTGHFQSSKPFSTPPNAPPIRKNFSLTVFLSWKTMKDEFNEVLKELCGFFLSSWKEFEFEEERFLLSSSGRNVKRRSSHWKELRKNVYIWNSLGGRILLKRF